MRLAPRATISDDVARREWLANDPTSFSSASTRATPPQRQEDILQEHWRVQFRRRYFTSRPALARSLAEFLRFYNDQRPHQGYRLRGQTPSALFHGAAAVPH